MQIAADVLNDRDIRIRASAIIGLGKSGQRDAVKPLTAVLENSSETDWLRACAAIALGRIAVDEVIPPLLNALGEASIEVSRAAVLALGDVKSAKALPALEGLLEDGGAGELHAMAVRTLGSIGGDGVVPVLLRALESPDNRVRCNAALALADLRAGEAAPSLINLLRDGDACLRAVAASALGLLGDGRAVKPLLEALSDRAETVRTVAASSLGYLGHSEAIPPLEKALGDESGKVRKQVSAALSKLRKATDQ